MTWPTAAKPGTTARWTLRGVTEYWIADVSSALVEVYRDPDPQASRYRTVSTFGAGHRIKPERFDVEISVDALFRPKR